MGNKLSTSDKCLLTECVRLQFNLIAGTKEDGTPNTAFSRSGYENFFQKLGENKEGAMLSIKTTIMGSVEVDEIDALVKRQAGPDGLITLTSVMKDIFQRIKKSSLTPKEWADGLLSTSKIMYGSLEKMNTQLVEKNLLMKFFFLQFDVLAEDKKQLTEANYSSFLKTLKKNKKLASRGCTILPLPKGTGLENYQKHDKKSKGYSNFTDVFDESYKRYKKSIKKYQQTVTERRDYEKKGLRPPVLDPSESGLPFEDWVSDLVQASFMHIKRLSGNKFEEDNSSRQQVTKRPYTATRSDTPRKQKEGEKVSDGHVSIA